MENLNLPLKSLIEETVNILKKRQKSDSGRSPIELIHIWDDIDDLTPLPICNYRRENEKSIKVFDYLKGLEEVTETSILENIDVTSEEIKRILNLFIRIGFLEQLSSGTYKVNNHKLILE